MANILIKKLNFDIFFIYFFVSNLNYFLHESFNIKKVIKYQSAYIFQALVNIQLKMNYRNFNFFTCSFGYRLCRDLTISL